MLVRHEYTYNKFNLKVDIWQNIHLHLNCSIWCNDLHVVPSICTQNVAVCMAEMAYSGYHIGLSLSISPDGLPSKLPSFANYFANDTL